MELKQFITVLELSTGRRLFALLRVLRVALTLGLPQLVQLLEQAIAHDRQTHRLDLRWYATRESRPSTSIVSLDARVDRAIKALRDGAVAQAEGAAAGDPVHQLVAAFLAEVLPVGVYAITSLPYVEQLNALEDIVENLGGSLAPMVAELGLGRQADRLSELLPQYRDAVNGAADGNGAVEFTTVRAARQRGQHYLHEVIAMILGLYYRADDPEHQDARAQLLGPIVAQNEAVRTYLRARRSVRDVDPETGEPVDEPGAPTADEAAVNEPAA